MAIPIHTMIAVCRGGTDMHQATTHVPICGFKIPMPSLPSRGGVMVATLLLAACSEGSSAEKQYNVMSRAGGSSADLCAQARKVSQAYLEDGNAEKYKHWREYSSEQCAVARLLRGTPYDDAY